MKKNIETFLSQFPDNAVSWGDATDEVRDLARDARLVIEHHDGVILEPVPFDEIESPSEWNTQGKKFIMQTFEKMSDVAKLNFYRNNKEWFDHVV